VTKKEKNSFKKTLELLRSKIKSTVTEPHYMGTWTKQGKQSKITYINGNQIRQSRALCSNETIVCREGHLGAQLILIRGSFKNEKNGSCCIHKLCLLLLFQCTYVKHVCTNK
jgi:hypothetical protein